MSKIQDSIKGSGGTIRSETYSEEWPWIDNKSDSFKFNGVVLDKLLSNWTEDEKEQEWLREFVLKCLLKSTGMLPIEDRKSILLEDILGEDGNESPKEKILKRYTRFMETLDENDEEEACNFFLSTDGT